MLVDPPRNIIDASLIYHQLQYRNSQHGHHHDAHGERHVAPSRVRCSRRRCVAITKAKLTGAAVEDGGRASAGKSRTFPRIVAFL